MTDVAPWSAAVELALNAPSVRNVQPWRFMLRDDALELHMSDDAFAEACDTTLRTVTISCGVVLHHLRVALRATGRTPIVELAGDPGTSALLATVRLGEPRPPTSAESLRASAITLRHTQRAAFDERPLRGELLDRLAVAAADEGAFLDVLRGDRRADACELVGRADRGLALQAPALAVLSGAGDGLRDQICAGQALSALLLDAALEGCWAGYLDAPLRDARARAQLRRLVTRGEVPMLLLRIGHAVASPRASRRPVGDVLEVATAPSS
jgi:nitroreductase